MNHQIGSLEDGKKKPANEEEKNNFLADFSRSTLNLEIFI